MNDGPVTSRLLAVDVGNSRVKFGMFDLASIVDGLPKLVDSLAAAPDGPMPWQEIRGWLGESDSSVPRGIVAGSNPLVRDVVVEGWPSEWPTPRSSYGFGLPGPRRATGSSEPGRNRSTTQCRRDQATDGRTASGDHR